MKNKSLSQAAINSGIWVFALSGSERIFSLIRTVVLARLIAPGDFGLMGVALLSISILEIFSETGFQVALIQKKQDIQPYLDSAWTIQVIRGIVLFVLLFAAAPLVAIFFHSPEAVYIVRIIAATVLLRGFINIGIVYFQKELEFHKRFVYEFSATFVELVVAISLALIFRNVWALVFGLLAASLMRCVMSYVLHPYRPRLRIDWGRAKELFRFGKWILFSTVIAFIGSYGDDIAVGKFLGVVALGLYQMSYRFSQFIIFDIFYITSKIGVPVYSKLQDNLADLKSSYSRLARLASVMSFPVATGMAILGGDFTRIFLGEKWLPMVPVLTLLAIASLIESIIFTGKPLFVGAGKPELDFQIQSVKALLLMGFIYPLAIFWGISGVALAVVLSVLGASLVFYLRLKSQLDITLGYFGNIFGPPLLASTVMVGAICFIKFLMGVFTLNTALIQITAFLLLVLFAVMIYFSVIYLFQRTLPDYQVLKDLVRIIKRA
jgi:O-antigen/teichoic acid export membrane protein